MNDPWTAVWGLTVGAGEWTAQRGATGENWDNCNRINNNKRERGEEKK